MDIFSFALALFNALAAIPKIAGYLEKFAAGVTMWFIQRAKQETYKEIADAAAQAARATTQEERQKALDSWRSALSKPRLLP